MWKKNDSEQSQRQEPALRDVPAQPMGEKAVIGPSLVVKGDVSGDEDLTIQGEVEGKVVLKKNAITVGKDGRVKADLYAKAISVEGDVRGNLFGEEKIVVRQTGKVKGNLSAPRVILEDGAKFKGSIDMESGAPDKRGSESKTPASAASGVEGASSAPSGQTSKGPGQPDLGIKINRPTPGK